MIVYVLCSLKICFKEKSLYYFHKKLKIYINPKKNTKKTFFVGFLGGFFWVGFFSVADTDPGLGAFLTPGSGIRDGRKSASGSGMNNPGHIF
jgi:hypothetical protein